jgi:Kef-type K+ transport system membrane component KefB
MVMQLTFAAVFVVALVGVIVPLGLGCGLGYIFNGGGEGDRLLESMFIGTVLTATSVSLTVEVLKEIGKLNTRVGNTILAAALIDDVLGLICLTVISALGGYSDVRIGLVLLKILLFFVIAGVVGAVAVKLLNWYAKKIGKCHLRRFHVFAFIICLSLSYVAERYFGVADIIGAFAAGLIVGNTTSASYMESKFQPLSYLLLTPVFFANIGLRVELPEMNSALLLFTVSLIAVAVVSKLIGCGAGARLCGMSFRESLQVGLGMACRGEVALIVANKGVASGIMPAQYMGPIIIMVLLISIATPVLLKLSFRDQSAYEGLQASSLAERFELPEQLAAIEGQLIHADQAARRKTPAQETPKK